MVFFFRSAKGAAASGHDAPSLLRDSDSVLGDGRPPHGRSRSGRGTVLLVSNLRQQDRSDERRRWVNGDRDSVPPDLSFGSLWLSFDRSFEAAKSEGKARQAEMR